MKKQITHPFRINILLIPLLFLFACAQESDVPEDKSRSSRETGSFLGRQELEQRERELERLQRETEELKRRLEDREMQLAIREAELDSAEQAVQKMEQDVIAERNSLKNLRAVAYLLLFVGIVMIVFGSFLLFRSRQSGVNGPQMAKAEQQPKPPKVPTNEPSEPAAQPEEKESSALQAGSELAENSQSMKEEEKLKEGKAETAEKPAVKRRKTSSSSGTARPKKRNSPNTGGKQE